MTGYQINFQKLTPFLYSSSKYLGMTLTNDLQNLYTENVQSSRQGDIKNLNKWAAAPCL